MNNQKILKLILIIVIVFIVGFLAYKYWWMPRQEMKVPEAQESERVGVLSDWKIYRNAEHGFEIQYPERYFPKASGSGIMKTATFYERIGEDDVRKVVIYRNFLGGWACTRAISSEEILVDGERGNLEIHASLDTENCAEIDQGKPHMGVLFINRNETTWFFQLLDIERGANEIVLFKTMLSTFRFLD